jgi:hypothetical protein
MITTLGTTSRFIVLALDQMCEHNIMKKKKEKEKRKKKKEKRKKKKEKRKKKKEKRKKKKEKRAMIVG